MSDWTRIADTPPPYNKTVETRIEDERGIRNEQLLKRRGERWWFPEDDSMYVYYTPTHWREK